MLPTSVTSVDVQDVMGSAVSDVAGDLKKIRIDQHGKIKLDAQGKPLKVAERATSEEATGQREEGCLVQGHIFVKKVPGNFHISAHAHADLLAALFKDGVVMNVSHVIRRLSFGEEIEVGEVDGQKAAIAPVSIYFFLFYQRLNALQIAFILDIFMRSFLNPAEWYGES
jgi:hypothetical protein